MPRLVDLTGQEIGFLTVLSRAGSSAHGKALWRCRCKCGAEIIRAAGELRKAQLNGIAASCGCEKMHSRRLDLTGDQYADLTVIGAGKSKGSWRCRCRCGNEIETSTNNLRTASVMSCGCRKKTIWHRHLHPAVGTNRYKDRSGETFGKLTFVEYVRTDECRAIWKLDCACGNTTEASAKTVVAGHKTSCGCAIEERGQNVAKKLRGRPQPLLRNAEQSIGRTYGKLTVRSVHYPEGTNAKPLARCICECGTEKVCPVNDLRTGRIITCGCGVTVSTAEQNLADLVAHHTKVTQQKNINGWVYDICVEEAKLLIEYNGCWWHSAKFLSNKHHHQIKRHNAEDAGYRVINIWSDDWEDNQARMMDLLLSAMGISNRRKIAARKSHLVQLDHHAANTFHATHHVQKALVVGDQHLGLMVDSELVAAATFKGNILARYTVRSGISVQGGLSKLLRASTLGRVITYCDRDHFTGSLYSSCGFTRQGTTLQMTYLYGTRRCRREKFMKHKLPGIGIEVRQDDTEKSALERAGIYQCFNSGIDRWEWQL